MAAISKRRRQDGNLSWDVTVRVRGHPTQCKSFRTRLEAETWAARIEAAAHGRTLALGHQITLAILIDEATPRLKSPLKAALAYWKRELGDLRLRDVTPTIIANHRDHLLGAPTRSHGHKRTRPRSPATVRHYLATLAAVFRLGVREFRYCDHNPVRDVTFPPAGPGRIRFLSDDERAALLKACRASEAALLYPFVLFLLTTGCRRGEAYGLRWSDVDIPRRWAIFPRTKNGDARGVPLVPAVVAELDKLPRTGDKVFPEQMARAWHTALTRAKVADFRMHDLRHSAASMLVQSGANLAEVAQLLGHKDIRMTQRYSHVHNQHTLALVDRVMAGVGS